MINNWRQIKPSSIFENEEGQKLQLMFVREENVLAVYFEVHRLI
jgi:hypothetical protein